MHHPELTAKTIITDLETKLDKNHNLYFKLSVKWTTEIKFFYAFADNLSAQTLQTLKYSPEKLINQLVLITYQALANQDKNGNFYKVKGIEIAP